MDDLLNIISKLNTTMSQYILQELEKQGYQDFALSHGKILINFINEEELNYKELSKRINKSPQTMTTLVRKLEKEEYLTLKVDPTDKRNKLVRLTEKGKQFIPVMMDISQSLFEKQYQGISDSEQKVLYSLLHKTLNNF